MIEEAWNNTGKFVEYHDKAQEYEAKAAYWETKAATINLSMPESIDFYAHKLETAKDTMKG